MAKILRDMNVSANGRRDSTNPFVGVLASDIPASGALPSFLLNDIDAGFPDRLYSVEILTLPSAGVLFLDKAGVGSFSGAPDGTYAGTQRVKKYDPGVGLVSSAESSYTLTVGGAAPASTVSSVVVSPAAATGSQQFAAIVNGANGPSQAVTWSKSGGGTLSASGLFTEPAKTSAVQTITITATSVQDPTKSGTATVTIPALVVTPPAPPTVTMVSITPLSATVAAGATQQFTATAIGTNSPAQTFTWVTDLGTVNASGLVTGPLPTDSARTGSVTATSTVDPTKSATATFTVPAAGSSGEAPGLRTVTLQLGEAQGPAANLGNLMVSCHAAPGPHATGVALYQSASETTDGDGVLAFVVDANLVDKGESVLLAVLAPDGRHYLGLVAVA